MASVGPAGASAAPVSLILRSGESCGNTKPSRTGRIRSLVRVWAAAVWSKPISASHADSAGRNAGRLLRPVAGPDITIGKLQHNHSLDAKPHPSADPRGAMSLMDLKQLWLMGR